MLKYCYIYYLNTFYLNSLKVYIWAKCLLYLSYFFFFFDKFMFLFWRWMVKLLFFIFIICICQLYVYNYIEVIITIINSWWFRLTVMVKSYKNKLNCYKLHDFNTLHYILIRLTYISHILTIIIIKINIIKI